MGGASEVYGNLFFSFRSGRNERDEINNISLLFNAMFSRQRNNKDEISLLQVKEEKIKFLLKNEGEKFHFILLSTETILKCLQVFIRRFMHYLKLLQTLFQMFTLG